MYSYTVTAHTSDVKGAGTDANVTLQLHGVLDGKDVQMGPFPLESSADDFRKGAADVFIVEGVELGEIKTATLQHDGGGFLGGSDWHLKMIDVEDNLTKKKTNFWCDRLVEKNAPVTLEPGGTAAHGRHRYVVEVLTSDIKGSGTDANVKIVIFGDKGDTVRRCSSDETQVESAWKRALETIIDNLVSRFAFKLHLRRYNTGEQALENSANNFEKGMTDTFHLEAEDVGTIERIRIGHDNSGTYFGNARWHCALVEVTNTTTGRDGSKELSAIAF